jgi:hypothetical protein
MEVMHPSVTDDGADPVVWRYKNVSYLPKIKKTNKKLLTSSHDSDYLMREAG